MDCLWTPWTSKGFGIEHKIYRNFFGLHGYLVDSVDSSTSRTFHSPTDSCWNPAGIHLHYSRALLTRGVGWLEI